MATRRGFTLVEMLISVALVLVLMLAVTKIFSITGAAVGASQGFSSATRDARAAQAVFAHDISSMAGDSPFIWIRYDPPVLAYRNKLDEQLDKDGSKNTIDLDSGATEGDSLGENVGIFDSNFRRHRLDRFSFCARDRFYRQTGNTANNQIVSPLSSAEAWITYGHLTLPYTNGVFQLGGDPTNTNKTNSGSGNALTNPQNFYASQWILGRVSQVMVLPTNAPSATPGTEFINSNGVSQEYYSRGASVSWTAASDNKDMTPLSDGTKAHAPYTSISLNDARYDLVGIDIAQARDRITRHISVEGAAAATTWFQSMLASNFQVNPFVLKPVNAANSSQQVPVFLPACSQFIVEYAGDFITQNANGSLDTTAASGGLVPDGQVDFNVIGGTRQIQWFGYPRSTNGNATPGFATGDVGLLGDFTFYVSGSSSLYNTYAKLNGFNPSFAAFEKFGTNTYALSLAAKTAYTMQTTYSAGLSGGTIYAAWGPTDTNRPKMYRITLVIDRPEMAGRTNDGMSFEYVFNAP